MGRAGIPLLLLAAHASDDVRLPGEEGTKPAVTCAPFPDALSAFVWRNWPVVDAGRMAQAIGCGAIRVEALYSPSSGGEDVLFGPADADAFAVTTADKVKASVRRVVDSEKGDVLSICAENSSTNRYGAWAGAGFNYPHPFRDISKNGAGTAFGFWVKGDAPVVYAPSKGQDCPFSVATRPGESARLEFEIIGPVKEPMLTVHAQTGRTETTRFETTIADGERLICKDGATWKVVKGFRTVRAGSVSQPLPDVAGCCRIEVTSADPVSAHARINVIKRYRQVRSLSRSHSGKAITNTLIPDF